ncbi:MAG: ABC transporter ATP-binding protein [Actinobacteria bacterium]|nr:ABC transporter ATP-binding protein [Actinomycetota bacterium]
MKRGAAAPLVRVEGLCVETAAGLPIVEDVSFSLEAGEALGVVGETGSGKSTSVLAMLGYSQPGSRITRGDVRVGDVRMTTAGGREQRKLRGKVISYVPQNPAGSLNPSMRIGSAIADIARAHRSAEGAPAVAEALERVGLSGDDTFQRRYPHQLSGGQQQRVCISVALVCEPPVVVLDEPATGLDVVTQARLLDELIRLRREAGVAMIYVTHDLAVVAGFADRIAVMYAGRIIEQGPAAELLEEPKHPYTRGLLNSIPDHARPRRVVPIEGVAVGLEDRPSGCAFAPRCPLRIEECTAEMPALEPAGDRRTARCLRRDDVVPLDSSPPAVIAPDRSDHSALLEVRHLRAEHRGRGEVVVAASDVSFTLGRGECVALVGESGSGKTTIARTIAGLHPLAGGRVVLDDEDLPGQARRRSRAQRRRIQIVFQDPSDALNPRHTVRSAVSRPSQVLRGLSRSEAAAEASRLLGLVRLPEGIANRYPAELSGGERQRVGIARALAATPDVMICDEITSALDVSVQAAVLNLIADVQASLGLSLLLITHDLGVVSTIANRVLVLEKGKIVEAGATRTVLAEPQHPYTKSLLAAAPSLSAALERPRAVARQRD